jgi:hypothetical protein
MCVVDPRQAGTRILNLIVICSSVGCSRRSLVLRIIVSASCLWLLVACGNDSAEPDAPIDEEESAATSSKDAAPPSEPEDSRGEPSREVPCIDTSISMLNLFDEPATAKIAEESSDADGFVHMIDTSAGGLMVNQSYIYARFTDDGLEKVEIGDEEAFESLDWDVAFRRYVIRLNSGVSGPGEVTGARTRPMTEFASLNEEPDGLEYRTEEYFTESCEFVPDTSGIGAPATALSSFWTYQECVQMTKNVYVLALPEDRKVKLEVLSYYTKANQDTCDMTGKVPSPSGAGKLRVRWGFLE